MGLLAPRLITNDDHTQWLRRGHCSARAHIPGPAAVADLNAYANRAGLSFHDTSSDSDSLSDSVTVSLALKSSRDSCGQQLRLERTAQQVLVRLTVDAIKILWPHKLLRVRSHKREGEGQQE